METLPCEAALIDGEAAFVLPSGVTDFKSLQAHIDTPHPAIRYFAFDLLSLDGKDLRKEPLLKRKERLHALLSAKGVSDYLVYSDHVLGSGPAFFAKASEAQLEGIMSKRADCALPLGPRQGLAQDQMHAVARVRHRRLCKIGRARQAVLLAAARDVRRRQAELRGQGRHRLQRARSRPSSPSGSRRSSARPRPSPTVPAAERKGAVWLDPELVCAVNYAEWTRDGRLRHPSFQGLREDKAARDVRREGQEHQEADMAKTATKQTTSKAATKTASTTKTGDVSFGGITLTSPDKVLYPDIGFTKLDLARYYEAVAPVMLPYVVNRPISLVRCPEGCAEDCFFQRHAMRGMSDAIKEVAIPGGKTKKKYLYIDGEDGLFGLAQIGVLEIHDWGVKLPKVSEPDHIVFDLDPDEGFDFDTLKAAAIEVRDFLDALGLTSFLKVTGGKGLHVVAPIAPKLGWDEVKTFCKAVADALVTVRPDRYTANMAKAARKGKIFVDYLRNQRGGTAICNYSTRARPGATVACPLRWDELKTLETAAPYTAQNLPARLKRLKKDPWEGYFATRQSITVKARKALGLA